MSDLWQQIAAHISQCTGQPFKPSVPRAVGGGCINQAVSLQDGDQHWFVKTNTADRIDMFEAEFAGLQAMADTQTIRVPRPLCTGVSGGSSYIVIEYVGSGGRHPGSQALAGEQLAAMHEHQAKQFGWHRDNTIGATPQPNAWKADWIVFWREQRLGFQLQLAAQNGFTGELQRLGEQLLMRCAVLLEHAPVPSLLHGDLWGGNIAFDQESNPVIFDPAVYYGDREADLAMTELFGGFGTEFYQSYANAWPLDPGYPVRKQLYNLYHVLNHANLFGGGYASQALSMTQSLLAEC